MAFLVKYLRIWQRGMTLQLLVMYFIRGLSRVTLLASFSQASCKLHWFFFDAWFFTNFSTHPLQINPNKYMEMIEENTIKFGTELIYF